MRFLLRVDDGSSLRLIPEIPDFPLCRIEGQNGAGKSLAVRVLQLCTGDAAYADIPNAWASFRASFEVVHVTATELSGGERIEWELHANLLPQDPIPLEAAHFARIEVDGVASDMASVRALVQVDRIGGDDTLPVVLSRSVRRDQVSLRRFRTELEIARLQPLGAALERIQSDLARCNVPRLRAAWNERTELEARLSDEVATREAHGQDAGRLREIVELQARIDRVMTDRPALETEVSQLDGEIADARSTRLELQHEIDTMRGDVERREEVAAKYDEVQNKLEAELERHAKERAAIQARATALGIPAKATDAAAEKTKLVARRRELEDRRRSLDVSPRLVQIGEQLARPLREAVGEGLGPETVADLDGEALSVARLAEGIATNQARLVEREAPAAAQRLDEELEANRQRAGDLQGILSQFAELERISKRITRLESQLATLRNALGEADLEAYRELLDRRESAMRLEIELTSRRSILLSQLQQFEGGRSLDELASAVSDLATTCGVSPSEAAPALATLAVTIADLDESIERLQNDLLAKRRVIGAEESALVLLVTVIESGEEYEQLRHALPNHLPHSALSLQQNAELVRRLEAGAERLSETLALLGDRLVALDTALAALAASIAGLESAQPKMSYWSTLRDQYEKRLAREFGQERIRQALFADGTFDRLSLDEVAVHWRDSRGRAHTRALEAFSSGERAFAYTLAQLSTRDSSAAANRLLALDEFGAFVSRGRLGELLAVLNEEVLDRVADQVVVILPLLQEPQQLEASLRQASPNRQLNMLAEHGYVASQFEVS
jgi:DNA repair exonuclease SbcCD ATPase subunit